MHHVHVVLDEQHGHALVAQPADVLVEALLERRVDAGHRLVEHHQRRVGHQRPGHLEQLALAARQRAGVLVAHVVEPEALEQLVGAGLDLALLARASGHGIRPVPPSSRHAGPVAPSFMFSMTGSLVRLFVSWNVRTMPSAAILCGGDAIHRLAVERPVAGVGLVEPGQQVEERRLAGAVGADQGRDRSALDLDVVDVDGGDAAEVCGARRRR